MKTSRGKTCHPWGSHAGSCGQPGTVRRNRPCFSKKSKAVSKGADIVGGGGEGTGGDQLQGGGKKHWWRGGRSLFEILVIFRAGLVERER